MNEEREHHSQCSIGDNLFVFFGFNGSGSLNSIEKINARAVINGSQTNWELIEFKSKIQPRSYTLAAKIDDFEIAILGGQSSKGNLGEVLLFNTESSKVKKVVSSNSNTFQASLNRCMMSRKGQIIGIDDNKRLIQFTKGEK